MDYNGSFVLQKNHRSFSLEEKAIFERQIENVR